MSLIEKKIRLCLFNKETKKFDETMLTIAYDVSKVQEGDIIQVKKLNNKIIGIDVLDKDEKYKFFMPTIGE